MTILFLFYLFLKFVSNLKIDFYYCLNKLDNSISEMLEEPTEEQAGDILHYMIEYYETLNKLYNQTMQTVHEDFVYKKGTVDERDVYDQANKVLECGTPQFFEIPIEENQMRNIYRWDRVNFKVLINCLEKGKKIWVKFESDFTQLKQKLSLSKKNKTEENENNV